MQFELSNGKKGAILAISGSILWGIMGAVCQHLLQGKGVSALWLVNMRMFFAGMLLLLMDYAIYRKDFFAVWRGTKNVVQMLVFSFVTIMAVQFTYLSAVNHMNAAMATVFVSLAPIATIMWVCIREHHLPFFSELICCLMAVLGAVIMATHGDFTSLAVSETGLWWGLALPFAGVVYTCQPGYLMQNYRPSNVTGWGLFLGGLVLLPLVRPWEMTVEPDMDLVLSTAYTIVFGTAVAFWTFLASLQYIKPHIAAIYELVEPLSAILLSVWLLGVLFEGPEMLGTAMIIAPVIYLSLWKPKKTGKMLGERQY